MAPTTGSKLAGAHASTAIRRFVEPRACLRASQQKQSAAQCNIMKRHQTISAAASSHAQGEPSMKPLKAAVEAFSSKLLAAPHRDLTHVPYGDWFALYVKTRKDWQKAAPAAPSSAAPTNAEQAFFQSQVRQSKTRIDALLWSSVFARHWTEVQGDADSAAGVVALSSTAPYRWWWHAESSYELPTTQKDAHAPVSVLELTTPQFLTEPLLGGNYLRLWVEEIREATTAATSEGVPVPFSATSIVLIPFSTLWEVKQSAYWRLSSTSAQSDVSGSTRTPAALSLSLQERQARQVLLQTVDQFFQLQRDAATQLASRQASFQSSFVQRVCVLSPTQEWDLLCLVPQLRQALYPASKNTTTASALSPSRFPVPSWLSIGNICEDVTTRLSYCAHALSWQQQRQHQRLRRSQPVSQASENSMAPAVRVLCPASEHGLLRSHALPSVHEHSIEKSTLDKRHKARQQLTYTGAALAATTTHDQARKGCSDAVRRMSHREENLRQSFSVR